MRAGRDGYTETRSQQPLRGRPQHDAGLPAGSVPGPQRPGCAYQSSEPRLWKRDPSACTAVRSSRELGLSSGPRAAATGPGTQSTQTVSPHPWWDGNLYLGHVLVLIAHPKEQWDQAPAHRPLHSPPVAPDHGLHHVSVETDGGHPHGARLLGERQRILARGGRTAFTPPPWHAAPAGLHLPAPCVGTRPGWPCTGSGGGMEGRKPTAGSRCWAQGSPRAHSCSPARKERGGQRAQCECQCCPHSRARGAGTAERPCEGSASHSSLTYINKERQELLSVLHSDGAGLLPLHVAHDVLDDKQGLHLDVCAGSLQGGHDLWQHDLHFSCL